MSKHEIIFKYALSLPAQLQDMETQGEFSGYPLHLPVYYKLEYRAC